MHKGTFDVYSNGEEMSELAAPDKLKEFLQREKEAADKKKNYEKWRREEWPNVQTEWLEALEALNSSIEEYLAEEIKDNSIEIKRQEVTISSDPSAYKAPSLLIITPSGRKIDIEPIGRMVIGANGSVIIKCQSKHFHLYREDIDLWKMKI